MEIGRNIAKFRKAKGLTQEELGKLIGVTNQAVSKWESGVSMPDISLLPAIVDVLGITFEILYGLRDERERIRPDEFPDRAYDELHNTFARLWYPSRYEQLGKAAQIELDKEQLRDGGRFTCVSNERGAVTLSDQFSYIDRSFKADGSEAILSNDRCASIMRKLSVKNVRKVLAFEYKASIEKSREVGGDFSLKEIAEACGISEEDAEEAVDILIQYEINEAVTDMNDCETKYQLILSRCADVFAMFKAAKLLTGIHLYEAVRDTSVISDSAFITDSVRQ